MWYLHLPYKQLYSAIAYNLYKIQVSYLIVTSLKVYVVYKPIRYMEKCLQNESLFKFCFGKLLSKTESLSKRSTLINLSTSSSHSSSLQKQTKEIEHHQIINFK